MTSYTNDPIRVKITLDDVWNCQHKQGIDSTWFPVPETNQTEFYVKLSCSDINPYDRKQENYIDDLEKEFEKLNILQDHCRDFGPYSHFNNCKTRTVEAILDEKVFSKDNRYDVLIDKFSKTIHDLPNINRKFITIEDS